MWLAANIGTNDAVDIAIIFKKGALNSLPGLFSLQVYNDQALKPLRIL
jgi:hypothetical protein